MVIFQDQILLSHLGKSDIPSSFAYHFLTAGVMLLLFEETSWISGVKCFLSVSVVSFFPYQEAESVEVILSVDQSAVASLWDVLMSNVTVSTASLQLKNV